MAKSSKRKAPHMRANDDAATTVEAGNGEATTRRPGRQPKSAEEKAALANETREDKFRRLGTVRVKKAVKAIAALGNLSNRSAYAYTPEQIETIFGALKRTLSATEGKFSKTKETEAEAITL